MVYPPTDFMMHTWHIKNQKKVKTLTMTITVLTKHVDGADCCLMMGTVLGVIVK